jgi:signal transduction histidine kinase
LRAIRRDRLAFFAQICVLAAVYVILARIGLGIHAISAFATLVWAPTGVSLAALLLLGNRCWPGIAVGALLANYLTGAPLPVALGIAAGNTLEALAGAYALRRIRGFRTSLDRLPDVLGLVILAAVGSSMVSATIGLSSLLAGGVLQPSAFWMTWRAWWLGDAIGDLIVAPLLLTFPRRRQERVPRRRLAEAGLLGVLLTLASYLLFVHTQNGTAWLLSPLLIWAALRFEQGGAARATFVVSIIAIWATTRGHGPFSTGTVEEGLFLLQAFMAVNAATFLVLGTVSGERRRAAEDASEANRAKDRFLAALSHELRTPLTPVLALSSMLERDANLPDGARRQIETMRRNVELEARLIDDLLDLTRIARGKLQIDPKPVHLSEAIDHVLEICQSEADAKGIVLERDAAVGKTVVRADPTRLRQVFWNLVKNGIRFTPRGGRVRIRIAPAAPGRIAVEISDTGAGIEPSDFDRIFHPFEQSRQRTEGLGLGLAISRAIVEAHGGTLSVSSAGAGRGSTFRVELAASSAEEPSRSADKIPRPAERTARARRVLLIEDHLDTVKALRELLSELSCEVFAVGSLKEAMAAAQENSFDLVLSDLGLPDGSGLDLMRQLRDRHGLSGIAVSGYGTEQDLKQAREAGFVDHLVKPITFERISEAIERFFASARA